MVHPLRIVTVTRVTVALVLACIAAQGCGSGDDEGRERAAVDGTVVLDGLPVENGTIILIPLGPKTGRKSGGQIGHGRYSIPIERGPNLGTYRVEISWLKPTGRELSQKIRPDTEMELTEAVPAKYNADSILTVEIVAGQNRKDFELASR